MPDNSRSQETSLVTSHPSLDTDSTLALVTSNLMATKSSYETWYMAPRPSYANEKASKVKFSWLMGYVWVWILDLLCWIIIYMFLIFLSEIAWSPSNSSYRWLNWLLLDSSERKHWRVSLGEEASEMKSRRWSLGDEVLEMNYQRWILGGSLRNEVLEMKSDRYISVMV